MKSIYKTPFRNHSKVTTSVPIQYKYLEYISEYDLIASANRTTPVTELYNALYKVLLNIDKDPNIY